MEEFDELLRTAKKESIKGILSIGAVLSIGGLAYVMSQHGGDKGVVPDQVQWEATQQKSSFNSKKLQRRAPSSIDFAAIEQQVAKQELAGIIGNNNVVAALPEDQTNIIARLPATNQGAGENFEKQPAPDDSYESDKNSPSNESVESPAEGATDAAGEDSISEDSAEDNISEDTPEDPLPEDEGGGSDDPGPGSDGGPSGIGGSNPDNSSNNDNTDAGGTSEGDSGGGGGSAPESCETTFALFPSLAPGVYTDNPIDLELIPTEPGNINYCVAKAPLDCNPTISYATEFDVGTSLDPGIFIVKAIGEADPCNNTLQFTYTVDPTAPDLNSLAIVDPYNTADKLIMVQSKERWEYQVSTSTVLDANYDYWRLKLTVNPSAYTCEEINSLYGLLSFGMDIDGNDVLNSADRLNGALPAPTDSRYQGNDLAQYGMTGNYLVSMLVNNNGTPLDETDDKYACQVQSLIVKDFEVFDLNAGRKDVTENSNPANPTTLEGTFNAFHGGRYPASNTYLEAGIENIVH